MTGIVISNYANRAVLVRAESLKKQSDILCSLLIKENYLNDSSSQVVNSKLELFCNIYDGRIILADRDFKIVRDTYNAEAGNTLLNPLAIRAFRGEKAYEYDKGTGCLSLAILLVRSPDVQQLQGVMLVVASMKETASNVNELRQKSIMIIGIIVTLSILLAYVLSTNTCEASGEGDESN